MYLLVKLQRKVKINMQQTGLLPLSNSPYRGDTGACGLSSAPGSFYRRHGHRV